MSDETYPKDQLIEHMESLYNRLAEKVKEYDDKELEELHCDLGTVKRGIEYKEIEPSDTSQYTKSEVSRE